MRDGRPQRALELARTVGQQFGTVASVTRFPTGMCHHVFDVELVDHGRVVVRIADPGNRPLLLGALAWSERLRPLGVPLPEVLAHDVAPGTPLPYVVLERLPGDDLGLVHATLSRAELRALAQAVVAVQAAVHDLGPGSGYGCSTDPAGRPPRETWTQVLVDNLTRSGDRLRTAPERVRRLHGSVCGLVRTSRPVLDQVPAVPFLDDLTTKNVIVDCGRLAGIVDVDVVCFGDPLFTPALTKASLVAADLGTDYVDAWLEALAPDGPALAAFDVYCAVFSLDILSEAGVTFNRDEPSPFDEQRAERLVRLAAGVLSSARPQGR